MAGDRTQKIDHHAALLGEISQQIRVVGVRLEVIEKRLFVDNGAPCIQTRLDRHDRLASQMSWMTKTALGAATASVVAVMVKVLTQ